MASAARSVPPARAAIRVSTVEKASTATWRRITMDGTAWRFNRYSERATEQRTEPSAEAGS
jgi:hypothetical protein